MLFILIILLVIIVKSSQVAPDGFFKDDYLSKDKTLSINGVFVVLVFLTHYSQYVYLGGIYDKPYLVFNSFLGQMVVAPFLFYSGFGIMESIKNKGFNYVKTVPTKRLLSLLINFDIAVLIFAIIGFLIGNTYTLKTYLLSLVGWTSLGNSSWYICATLVLYVLVFASFFVVKWLDCNGGRLIGCILLTVLAIAFVYIQMVMDRPSYTYNTVILFPLGCWYSLFKPQIDKIVIKNDFSYLFFCVVNLIVCMYFFSKKGEGIVSYSFWAISFTLMIVLFTMKISIKSNLLEWLGKHIFSIYILQRIPMILLDYFGLSTSHKYIYFVISLATTLLISVVYDNLTGKLINKIYNKSVK